MVEGRRDLDCANLEATELRLGIPGSNSTAAASKQSKRALANDSEQIRSSSKAQLVGWPPVRSSFRRNTFQVKKPEAAEATSAGILVKVSMDGAPYLRKIDLKIHNGYEELRETLEDMFKAFPLSSECDSSEGESSNGTMHAIAYEDMDGDWMLAGDVPWEMFISSCRRLRILKGSEARGLASNY